MLTSQLRELEADGLIGREVFATVPPTVEYRLTEFGQTILPMMEEIKKWGLVHRSRQGTALIHLSLPKPRLPEPPHP